MRNVLLTLFIVLCSFASASAQIVTAASNSDSSVGYYNGLTTEVHNHIKSGSSAPMVLRWSVLSANFGTGWDMIGSGVCDNNLCYSATPGSASNNIFNNGSQYTSYPYNTSFGDFHVVFASTTTPPPLGSSAVVRVSMRDTSGATPARLLTFIAYKAATGVTNINSSDDVVIYPIPARKEVNVVFDESAGIKYIAVYNLIGKLMGPVYRPSANGSARIDISDIPSGIYFLRLMDATGRVAVTRRFTKQM